MYVFYVQRSTNIHLNNKYIYYTMKLSIANRFLKSGSVALLSALALITSNANAETYYVRGASSGTKFPATADETYDSSGNAVTTTANSWLYGSTNSLYFASAENFKALTGVDAGSNTTASFDALIVSFANLTVEEDATINYLRIANMDGNSGSYRGVVLQDDGTGSSNFSISDDFTLDINSSNTDTAHEYARALYLATDWNLDISEGSTFTLYGFVARSTNTGNSYITATTEAVTINISGGGTFDYQSTATASNITGDNAVAYNQFDHNWVLSDGSTLNISKYSGVNANLLGTGTVTFNGGNLSIAGSLSTIVADFIMTGVGENTLSSNDGTALTLSNSIIYTAASEGVALNLNGSNLEIGETFTLDFSNVDISLGEFDVFTNTGAITGYENIEIVGLDDYTYTIEYDVDQSKLYIDVTSVPEPSTATLSLLALAGLLARRRRKA